MDHPSIHDEQFDNSSDGLQATFLLPFHILKLA